MTLDEYIYRNGGVGLNYLRSYSKQMMKTLAWLHSINIVHCDIKPDNMMFETDKMKKLVLIDFGLASNPFDRNQGKRLVSAPAYRAPEVQSGFKWDSKVDVWSLGCVLAEAYLGNYVFDFEDVDDYVDVIEHTLDTTLSQEMKQSIIRNKIKRYKKPEVGRLMPFNLWQRIGNKFNENGNEFVYVQMTQFKDLLKHMLECDPRKRWSMKQCLDHEFFKLSSLKY